MLIPPLDRVSWGLKESHSLFPSWGGLLVGGCCLTFTVCISLLELTWKLTTASRCPGSNLAAPPPHHPHRHARLTKALTLSSSPFWPFRTALFNAHKSHTDGCWILGEVLTETYGCWWITCIIEVYENRLYPPRLRHVTHRHHPWSHASTAVGSPQPEWATHSLFYLLQPRCMESYVVRAVFSLRDPQTGSLIIVTNKSNNCSIIWELHSNVGAFFNTLLLGTDGPALGRDSSLEELQ